MAARKSILFLNSVIPVTKTHDDLIKDKLKPGKYVFTIPANIKIASVIVLLTSLALNLTSTFCEDEMVYRNLLSIGNGITLSVGLIFYLVFSFGLIIKRPGLWVTIDISSNLLLSILTIVSAILCMTTCQTPGSLLKVPGPLSIVGGVLVMFGCAALFLLYRYKEDEDFDVNGLPTPKVAPTRKSIFA